MTGRPEVKLTHWEARDLGPSGAWHPLLQSTAQIVLKSKTPMLLAWGPDLRLYFNSEFASILGGSWTEAFGRSMPEVWSTAWPHFADHVQNALAGEGVLVENFAIPTQRSGFQDIGYFSFSYTPVFDGAKVAGLLCVCTETTVAVENEERLKRLQAELIHLSRWSAMESMASSLAHEVNQPLTAIAGYIWAAQRLLNGGSGERREAIDAALAGANNSVMAAGDIVKRARELLSKHAAKQVPVDGVRLLEETRALIARQAHEKGVKLIVETPQELTILADANRIQQVLLSVTKNALEAMEGRSNRELRICASKGPEFAKISVADTGPGFSDEARACLFKAFRSSKEELSGLGLSISRTIVETHRGRIWLEDTAEGAEVCFTLPLAESSSLSPVGAAFR